MGGGGHAAASDNENATRSGSLWFSSNPSKTWGELFFLLYTPFWLTLCLGIIVPYKLYESFAELEYLLVGLISAVPSFLLPLLLVGKADRGKPWKERYWVKASLWIIIFSYVGNYFWTHYFFKVLGASYTFPSWRMNNVPHTTFLLTHVCFLFYHVTSNLTLRRLRHFLADSPKSIQFAIEASWVLALSYFIAYLETIAISNFPYYDFVDRAAMYKVGSLFYAIYFIVSFPMFIRLDELEREEAAGGRNIDRDGHRVLGVLATSRSIATQMTGTDTVKMMHDVQRNTNSINLYLSDQRMMHALGMLLNVKLRKPTV